VKLEDERAPTMEMMDLNLVGTWVVNVTTTQSAYATGRRLRLAHRRSSNWRRTRPVALSPKPTRDSTSTAQDRRFTSTEAMAMAHGNKREGASRLRKLHFSPTGDYVGNADLREHLSVDQPNRLWVPSRSRLRS
jgi:hypothetical protein